jgi:hypothetical protein
MAVDGGVCKGANTWVTARAMLLKNMPEASVNPRE